MSYGLINGKKQICLTVIKINEYLGEEVSFSIFVDEDENIEYHYSITLTLPVFKDVIL